jgi:hypothetical protein
MIAPRSLRYQDANAPVSGAPAGLHQEDIGLGDDPACNACRRHSRVAVAGSEPWRSTGGLFSRVSLEAMKQKKGD